MASSQDARFEELYSRYFREVLAYCMRRGSADDAYDTANEVFTIAWRRLADVPAGESARPWLYVVARRVLYRRRRGTQRFSRLTAKVGAVRHHGSPDPETVVVQRAEYETVLQAASQLSSRDREVLEDLR
jgi:RNA polymerase sigma-70 factor (ECF subfamily)